MRRQSLLTLLVLLLLNLNSSVSIGQTGQSPVQQANAAAGWGVDWSSMAFTFTATVQTPDGSAPIGISGEFQGVWKARVSAQANGSTTAMVVNGKSAAMSSDNGIQVLPFDAVYDSLAIFPFLTDMNAASDPAISITDQGAVAVGSIQTDQVTIHRAAATDPTQSRRLSMQASDTTVWLAADTLLPLQIENYRPGIDNSSATVLVHREYADYQVVNGIAVPFTIREFIGGNLTSTTSITAIQFGVTLPDSDFTIPN